MDGTFTTYNLGKHNKTDNIFTKEIFKDVHQKSENII